MFDRIDHLVIAVADPDRAAADLEEALGIACTGGGRHASGTWNRLAFCGDTYLELIGVWDAALANAHPIGRATVRTLDTGEGLATWALAVEPGELEGAVEILRAVGAPVSDPLPGHRDRPDGMRTTWATAFLPVLGLDEPPFLIEHEGDGPEWSVAARAERARFLHPFGGTARLIGMELLVDDPGATAERYRAGLGIRFAPAAGARPGAREARVGEQSVRLVAAADDPGAPRCHVGILGDAGLRELVDLFGVRFARL